MNTSVSATQEKKAPTGKRRSFTGALKIFITVVTVALAVFQLYTAFFGVLPAMQQRSLHLAHSSADIPSLPHVEDVPQGQADPFDWIFLRRRCTVYVYVMYEDSKQGGYVHLVRAVSGRRNDLPCL